MQSVTSGSASEFLKLASQVLPVFFLAMVVDAKMLGAGPEQEAPRFSSVSVVLLAIAELLAIFGWLMPAGRAVVSATVFVSAALILSVVLLSVGLVGAHLRQMRANSPAAPLPTSGLRAKLNKLLADHPAKVDGVGSAVLFGLCVLGGVIGLLVAPA